MPRLEGPWRLKFVDEATACPACGSPRLALIDAFTIPGQSDGRRVSFVSGCRNCGLLFTNPMPPPRELNRSYQPGGPWAELRAGRMARLESANRRRVARPPSTRRKPLPPRSRALFDALAPHVPIYAPPPGAKVLDFGCGDGKLLNRLQDLGWLTYGIEPSTDAPFVRHGRFTDPPQDGSFDLVVINHVLEHVLNPLDILTRLAESLRQGGALFVSVPRLDTLAEHRNRRSCLSGRNHPMCFSETCLRGLLARAGCVTAARLDARELDDVFTEGKPLRLRLVANRSSSRERLPASALRDAVRAWSSCPPDDGSVAAMLRRLLPVRVRAGLMARGRVTESG